MTESTRPVIIYISAASDLMAEREVLARMIATLPVTLAWQILQTPIGDERFDPTPLAAADLHVLVMGGDIRAPVGAELYAARQVGQPTMAFVKRGVARTSAGQVFVKDSRLIWQAFTDAADLSRQVQRSLANHLIRHAIEYVLTPVELEQLEAIVEADTTGEPAVSKGTEAGRSAVVLSRERFTPSEGVIVEDA